MFVKHNFSLIFMLEMYEVAPTGMASGKWLDQRCGERIGTTADSSSVAAATAVPQAIASAAQTSTARSGTPLDAD
jgi:hypothetical protein